MKADEIITEVHAIKDSIGLQYGNDLAALFRAIKLGESELKAGGAEIVAPPTEATQMTPSALQRTRFLRHG